VGIRTKDGEALAGEDYVAIDEQVVFGENATFQKVNIKIIDDDGWEPDENFYVELYDLETGKKLEGADTETKVTIIDDDKPGNLQFKSRLVPALVTYTTIQVDVIRKDGNDGLISCEYKLEEAEDAPENQRARIGEDFEAKSGTVTFKHQETSQSIEIKLFPSK